MKNKNFENSNNIYAIHSPRFNIYHANGTGRDSYIYSNNGGACKAPLKINKTSENGPFNFARYYNLSIHKNPVKYFSDGTGRDAYVMDLATSTSLGENIDLPNILRTPAGNNFSPKKIRYYSKQESEANKELKLKETNLLNRLFYSSPNRNNKSPQVKESSLNSPVLHQSIKNLYSSNKLNKIRQDSNLVQDIKNKSLVDDSLKDPEVLNELHSNNSMALNLLSPTNRKITYENPDSQVSLQTKSNLDAPKNFETKNNLLTVKYSKKTSFELSNLNPNLDLSNFSKHLKSLNGYESRRSKKNIKFSQ